MIIRIGLRTQKLRFRQLIKSSGVQAILYCEEVTVGAAAIDDVAVGSTQTSQEDPLPEHDLFKRTVTLKIIEHFEKNPPAHGAHVTDQGARTMEDVILLLV